MNTNLTFSTVKKVVYPFLLCLVFVSNANAKTSNSTKFNLFSQTNYSKLNDPKIVLTVEIVNFRKILRISFNGNEGTDGKFNIYDNNGSLVSSSNFELIKSPFYASVDVTTLEVGNYSVVLITNQGNHNATLQIK